MGRRLLDIENKGLKGNWTIVKKIIITTIVIGTISIALFACGGSSIAPEQGQTTNTKSVSTTSVAESKADTSGDAVSETVEANEMAFYRVTEFKVAN